MLDGNPANFTRLKQAVRLRAEERLGIRKAFVDWSLNDIRDFQADLESVCKSSVSEKWFYTHLKNESDKLPRIDVLNLLSGYCGYKNWDAFVFQHRKTRPSRASSKPFLFALLAAALIWVAWQFWPKADLKVMLLIDAYTQEEIPMHTLNMHFKNGPPRANSPSHTIRVAADTLVIDGAYYKRKEVYIGGDEDTLRVTLFPDDYALMLNYFSRSTTEDWQRRRQQLLEAIHPEAKIFQSHPQYEGIELLNRDEFIDRLILPVNSLKNLEIQDIVYKDEKIYRLRFLQLKD
jgi:hypothetical protein